jgi:hypothetical protein
VCCDFEALRAAVSGSLFAQPGPVPALRSEVRLNCAVTKTPPALSNTIHRAGSFVLCPAAVDNGMREADRGVGEPNAACVLDIGLARRTEHAVRF